MLGGRVCASANGMGDAKGTVARGQTGGAYSDSAGDRGSITHHH